MKNGHWPSPEGNRSPDDTPLVDTPAVPEPAAAAPTALEPANDNQPAVELSAAGTE